MELIIGLLVICAVGYVVFFRKKDEIEAIAPYKVDVSVTGTAVIVEPAVAIIVEDTTTVTIVEEVKVAEAPAVVEEPTVVEEPAKKTRKPRVPKAVVAAKKPAPIKKAVVKKPAVRTASKSKKI